MGNENNNKSHVTPPCPLPLPLRKQTVDQQMVERVFGRGGEGQPQTKQVISVIVEERSEAESHLAEEVIGERVVSQLERRVRELERQLQEEQFRSCTLSPVKAEGDKMDSSRGHWRARNHYFRLKGCQ
jgi:hypothetical protein